MKVLLTNGTLLHIPVASPYVRIIGSAMHIQDADARTKDHGPADVDSFPTLVSFNLAAVCAWWPDNIDVTGAERKAK